MDNITKSGKQMKYFWLDPKVNLRKDGYLSTLNGPATHSSEDIHEFDSYFHKLVFVGYFPDDSSIIRMLGEDDFKSIDEEISKSSNELTI